MLASALPLLLSWPGGGDFHSGAPANGDQLQYVHAPLDFIRRHWEAQKKPSPGPAIDFNTTFGIVGLNAIRAPAKITFPYPGPGSGRSLPIKNAATDFTAVCPCCWADLPSRATRICLSSQTTSSCTRVRACTM